MLKAHPGGRETLGGVLLAPCMPEPRFRLAATLQTKRQDRGQHCADTFWLGRAGASASQEAPAHNTAQLCVTTEPCCCALGD